MFTIVYLNLKAGEHRITSAHNTMKEQLINQAVKLYADTLHTPSIWYAMDLANFKRMISTFSVKELKERIQILSSYEVSLPKKAAKEIKKMDAGGLFDINSMNQANALS